MEWQNMIRPLDLIKMEQHWIQNDRLKGNRNEIDFKPVVKLFTPWAGATWLLSEKQPQTTCCFGLCDLNFGMPELGYVDLKEVWDLVGFGGIRVEQDIHFEPTLSILGYAAEARRKGRIVT